MDHRNYRVWVVHPESDCAFFHYFDVWDGIGQELDGNCNIGSPEQCTGRVDRNDEALYAGDIVEHKYYGSICRNVIFWDSMKAGFYLARPHMYKDYVAGVWGHHRGEHLNARNKTKVGNIHENPEMLEE